MPTITDSPPRAPPVQYATTYGTRWQKEKAAAAAGAFDYPDDAKYVGPWIIGECVGKGASGHVKIARHRRTGQLAAVKILPLDLVFSSRTSLKSRQAKSEKQRLGIDREIIMMKLMNHPNIMRIYDVYEGDNELYLILEYVEGGELFDFLVNRGKLPPLEALAYFKQIIYGLSYAHAFSIIHRDLKPENILIHSLNPPLIKIADWGMAAFAPPSLQLETSCGSPHYASPEIVNGHKYEGTATDIWSCGVILFALLTGRLPFDDKNVRILLSKVKSGKYDLPPWVDPQAKDLVKRMLVVDVAHRITIPDILAHPWLQNPTPGVLCVPAPSVTELARPLRSAGHIDPDVLECLTVIWGRHGDIDKVKSELLSTAGNGMLAKAFYFLLQKHRERTYEEHGIFMDVDCGAIGEKAITKLYLSPLSKKPRPLSLESTLSASRMLPPPMERGISAPSSYQPPSPNTLSPGSVSPGRRSRPPSPAGPREHRRRPVSTPSPYSPQFTRNGSSMSGYNVPAPPRSTFAAPTESYQAGYRERASSIITHNTHQSARPLSPHLQPFHAPTPISASAHLFPSPNPNVRSSFLPMSPVSPVSPTPSTTTPLPIHAPTPILPPINAPRIANASFQRTIDDIAGRMNVLNAAFARSQVNARAEALHLPQQHSAYPFPQVVGRQYHRQPHPNAFAPFSVEQGVYRSTDEDHNVMRSGNGGAYANENGDKENVSLEMNGGQAPGAKKSEAEDAAFAGQCGAAKGHVHGHGHGAGLGREMSNLAFGTELIQRAPTRKDRKIKPPALELGGSGSPRRPLPIGSPIVSSPSPSLLGSPAVGEFKGWFSNLFNWKTQTYALHSLDGAGATRAEACRLLSHFGVSVHQEDGVLRCRVDDGYDPHTGALVLKHVRFRIEFAVPPPGTVPLSPRRGGSGSSPYSCTMVLAQEKGAVSTFRAVYQRLREEWRLDALHSPTVGFGTPMETEGVQAFAAV
ncbi:Pkinase-domain-containing protein [Dentipellis sp. KUC8613]|nr:Pkinase-domain-containing protein [Dentipellis sp. KUC8613]